jgi:4-carboxymuconolactone decarboxylase
MTDWRDRGLNVFREMLPGVLPEGLPNEKVSFGTGFGSELMEIGIEGVFGRLWSREGLSRRDRSLVTLGILIALRAEDELESHFRIAKQNGLTEEELEEVVYHATGYAGFPAGNTAKAAALRALKPDNL